MFPNVLLQFWINCELIHSIVLFWQLVNIAFTVATIDKVSDAIAAAADDDYICKCMYIYCFSNKGVQVELGIPYELWDKPSAEVSKMHRAVSHQHSALSSKLVNVICSLQLIHFQNVNKCWLIWVDIFLCHSATCSSVNGVNSMFCFHLMNLVKHCVCIVLQFCSNSTN